MPAAIRPFAFDDYKAAVRLWQESEGVCLSRSDEPEAILRYLERNPGSSFVAVEGDLIGTILAGHDGRRGYLHHLAVAESHRSQGVGRALVQHALEALREQGLEKVHLFVRPDNADGIAFWHTLGWAQRDDITMFSYDL